MFALRTNNVVKSKATGGSVIEAYLKVRGHTPNGECPHMRRRLNGASRLTMLLAFFDVLEWEPIKAPISNRPLFHAQNNSGYYHFLHI